MRTKTMKNVLLWIASIFLFISLAGLFWIQSMQKKNARAEATWQTGVFEMNDGVSLRLSDENGMRFIVKMDEIVANFVKENDSAEMGFVIAPKQLMLEANGDYLNMEKQIGGAIDKNKIYQEGDYYQANACITGVKLRNFKLDFVAVAYIRYNGEVRYTEYNDYARQNMYDLVNMAFLNGYANEIQQFSYLKVSDEIGWYGSEEFPIVVENTDEYNEVVALANDDNINLENNYVVVKNNATTNDSFTAETPIILSSELDEVNKLIAALPDSITMPDAIGQIGRIRDVEKKYNALSDENKAEVENYAKVETLLQAIEGYDRVYKNDATDGTVIPSYVPGGYSSTNGGTATTRTDDVYGNVLTVKSDANGKAALHIQNFPDVSKYSKVYFYARIIGVSCDIYLSDGIINDGWGIDWNNTWSTEGFWCGDGNWRLFEINLSDGEESNDYINGDFALGFRTNTTGFTFEISDFYGYVESEATEASLMFGTQTDSGETNEYGKVYNISREQWYIDNNNTNTIGTLQANKLANALPAGFEYFYFWMYNGTGAEYNFHLAGDVSGTWTDSADSTPLKVGEWTKVTISAADIELNKGGQWYVYILGGDGAGAAKDGWKISTIYAGPYVEYVYTDYADVKDVIALINALPATATLADKAKVEAARAAYDALTSEQQSLVDNVSKLTAAETAIEDIESANEVIALIDSIDERDVDEALVSQARAAYDELSDTAKTYVTNIATLEAYEEEIRNANALTSAVNNVNTLIANLPDSVVMPDNLVFVPRIEEARDAYNALSEEGKGLVENYAKLRSLLSMIKGYTTVYRQSLDGVSVIPSHVPNYTSTIGGTASMGYDGYYGDYLKATPNSGGKVAIQFTNFPSVTQYSKIYFNIRVVGASCDLYLSDGITNGGWGDGWHSTWSMSGLWANNGNWIQKEFDLTTSFEDANKNLIKVIDIFSSNWALGLRTNTTGVSFEITDIIGWAPELGTASGLTFGNFTDSGTTNEYGTVYNFEQGWSSNTDMGAFNAGALNGALAEGHDTLHFWIYNPNDSAVNFNFTGEYNEYTPQDEYVTELAPKAWTEVVITSRIIQENKDTTLVTINSTTIAKGLWYITVSSGAGTEGWQISPIYSYNSQATSDDAITKVQARIDALDVNLINQEAVDATRKAYEALNEAEKAAIVNIDKLIACEQSLYDLTNEAPFVVDGTQYKIYYESGYKAIATFMQEQIEAATGARLELVSAKPTTITQYRYAIVLGYSDLAKDVIGSSLDGDALQAIASYSIRRNQRAVFIESNSEDGYRMAALAFLRNTIGYDMISEDCVIYSKDGSVIPALNLCETPSFGYRQQQTYMTEDEVFGMGLQAHTDLWIASDQGWDMHNTLHYLPVATYGSAHSNWYTSDKTQICPTAGGSSAEFNAMVDAIVANMMVRINAYPNKENISFSIMDSAGGDDCTCARCTLYDTLYGEAGFSAAWIDLMNAINEKIRAQIGDRKLNIAFLAYRSTEKAPANIDANGNVTLLKRYQINDDGSYTQTSEDLKCDDGVMVWLAPIDGKYAENFNHADNAATLALIKKWCALSDNVYLWMYGTNFKFYMYPYNTWQASAENYKILADLGVKGAWSQSNETEATAFSDLKAYIDSKFMFDVNANYEDVLDTYFTNYFGAGAEKMRSMFDKIVAKCEEIEANYDGLGRGIYDEIENKSGFLGIGGKTYWSKDWINSLVTLCDEAKAAVEADSSLKTEQKTVIINRITKESLFPRYVLCTTFASSYSNSNKEALRAAFKADATALGFTLYREADGSLSDLYSEWGV
ncbi:MAG: DUF4838 domain-containing protein [Clostridia bacterium]|nr:DUF4838 domain-containing protein [Clostridia bacterium]